MCCSIARVVGLILLANCFNSCGPIQGQAGSATEQQLLAAISSRNPNAYRLVNPRNANAVFPSNWRGSDNQWRAIHAAAFNLDKNLVNALIENGADLNVRSQIDQYYSKKMTPAEMAAMRNGNEISHLITRSSGESNALIARNEQQFRARASANMQKQAQQDRILAQERAEQRRRDAQNRGIPEYRTCSSCNGTGDSNGNPLIMLPCGTCWGSGQLRNY